MKEYKINDGFQDHGFGNLNRANQWAIDHHIPQSELIREYDVKKILGITVRKLVAERYIRR